MLITWKRKPNTRHQHVEPSKLPNEILRQHPQYQNHKIANLWVNTIKYYLLRIPLTSTRKNISFKNGGQIELSQKIHIVMVPIKEFRNFFTFIQKRREKNEIN